MNVIYETNKEGININLQDLIIFIKKAKNYVDHIIDKFKTFAHHNIKPYLTITIEVEANKSYFIYTDVFADYEYDDLSDYSTEKFDYIEAIPELTGRNIYTGIETTKDLFIICDYENETIIIKKYEDFYE